MDYSSYKFLKVELQPNGVLLLTMNRPEVLNACDNAGHQELAQIWLDFDRDPKAKVALITGAGRAFCAGGDMREKTTDEVANAKLVFRDAGNLVNNMINIRKPVVSAINGVAVGAGLAVALLADISIAADNARLIDGHTKLGVVAGDHAALIWPLLCGLARAKYYLLLCEDVLGKDAAAMGLVSRSVPAEELMATALKVADRLANGSQWAIQGTKQALNSWLKNNISIFNESLALELASLLLPDMKEGQLAFAEKRAPKFPSAQVAD